MSVTTLFMTLVHETCCTCGVGFGIEKNHRAELQRTHKWFYCPNGHSQHYTGETDAERERKAREAAEARAERDKLLVTVMARQDERDAARAALRTAEQVCRDCGLTPCGCLARTVRRPPPTPPTTAGEEADDQLWVEFERELHEMADVADDLKPSLMAPRAWRAVVALRARVAELEARDERWIDALAGFVAEDTMLTDALPEGPEWVEAFLAKLSVAYLKAGRQEGEAERDALAAQAEAVREKLLLGVAATGCWCTSGDPCDGECFPALVETAAKTLSEGSSAALAARDARVRREAVTWCWENPARRSIGEPESAYLARAEAASKGVGA